MQLKNSLLSTRRGRELLRRALLIYFRVGIRRQEERGWRGVGLREAGSQSPGMACLSQKGTLAGGKREERGGWGEERDPVSAAPVGPIPSLPRGYRTVIAAGKASDRLPHFISGSASVASDRLTHFISGNASVASDFFMRIEARAIIPSASERQSFTRRT